jgi:hypothetical protein
MAATNLMSCRACGIESDAADRCPVCGTPAAAADLDRLTREVTAFESWAEFAAAMAGGYCPTLRPSGGRGRRQCAWNATVAELAGRVRAAGFKVFDGRRVA